MSFSCLAMFVTPSNLPLGLRQLTPQLNNPLGAHCALPAQAQHPSSAQRDYLGLDLIELATEIARDLLDRRAAGQELLQVSHVHPRPRRASIDGGKPPYGLGTHTQHKREYRSGRSGIRVFELRCERVFVGGAAPSDVTMPANQKTT